MQKTYLAKKGDFKRSWYIADAKDKILGRLAVEAAKVLRGNHKPRFTSNIDCGDNVIIINDIAIYIYLSYLFSSTEKWYELQQFGFFANRTICFSVRIASDFVSLINIKYSTQCGRNLDLHRERKIIIFHI